LLDSASAALEIFGSRGQVLKDLAKFLIERSH